MPAVRKIAEILVCKDAFALVVTDPKHNEAQALSHARRQECEEWQGEKDQLHGENKKLRQQIVAPQVNQT